MDNILLGQWQIEPESEFGQPACLIAENIPIQYKIFSTFRICLLRIAAMAQIYAMSQFIKACQNG